MALRIDRGELLHPVEVELLCTFAEVDAPFPLRIPSSGQSDVERVVVFAGAREQLTDRGLADENGPLGVADDFVYLLRSSTGVLDLVLAQEKTTMGAVVLTYRDDALMVTQDASDPEGLIRMNAVTLDDAVDHLLRLIPAMDTSPSAPFSLPRRALEGAFRELQARMPQTGNDSADPDGMDTTAEIPRPNPMGAEEIDELLRTHGIDDRTARRMTAHLQPVLGNGQAGVARRDDTEDQWRRVGEELRWLDTERGRFRLTEDGDWMSVNPLARDEIRAGLRRLAATIRG